MNLIDKDKLIEKIRSTPSGCFYTGPDKIIEIIEKEPTILCCVIKAEKDDAIVIKVDMDKIGYDYTRAVHDAVSELFPYNKVLTMPLEFDIETTKEHIVDITESK